MTNIPKLYHDGQQITTRHAAAIGREFLSSNFDIERTELSAIFRRAVYGEEEARSELFDLLSIEMIG